MLIEFLTDKKAFQSNVTAVFGRMNKHPYSNRAIPSCEMARTFSSIYDRFDGNSSADMLEKSTSDWIRGGKPARKTCTIIKAPLSIKTLDSIFCRLDPRQP